MVEFLILHWPRCLLMALPCALLALTLLPPRRG